MISDFPRAAARVSEGFRVVIQTDRRLTPPEIRALYARPEEGD